MRHAVCVDMDELETLDVGPHDNGAMSVHLASEHGVAALTGTPARLREALLRAALEVTRQENELLRQCARRNPYGGIAGVFQLPEHEREESGSGFVQFADGAAIGLRKEGGLVTLQLAGTNTALPCTLQPPLTLTFGLLALLADYWIAQRVPDRQRMMSDATTVPFISIPKPEDTRNGQ